MAAYENDTETLLQLLNQCTDPNSISETGSQAPLHRAAETGAIDCAEILIQWGA